MCEDSVSEYVDIHKLFEAYGDLGEGICVLWTQFEWLHNHRGGCAIITSSSGLSLSSNRYVKLFSLGHNKLCEILSP